MSSNLKIFGVLKNIFYSGRPHMFLRIHNVGLYEDVGLQHISELSMTGGG